MNTRAVAALEAFEHLGTLELSPQEILEQVAQRVARVIGVDAYYAGAVDPDTGLCLGAGVAHNLAREASRPFWEHELLIPDFNKFADLTPARPVADLREATGGRLSRSARYRVLSALAGVEDELRAVLHAGGRTWGVLQLNRMAGGAPFSPADQAFLRAVAPLAGAALRRALLEEPATTTDPARGPGVVLLEPGGTVAGVTPEAEAWLSELSPGWPDSDLGLPVHPDLLMVSLTALQEGGPARRVRLRTANGTWLVAQASPLPCTGQVALVIEPAKASEILPIVVEALGLTPREVEVTLLVARGLSTEDIAAQLFLSRHTVRDYLKAIFEKVGVSSRAQLTSRLFAEHYQPPVEPRVDSPVAAAA